MGVMKKKMDLAYFFPCCLKSKTHPHYSPSLRASCAAAAEQVRGVCGCQEDGENVEIKREEKKKQTAKTQTSPNLDPNTSRLPLRHHLFGTRRFGVKPGEGCRPRSRITKRNKKREKSPNSFAALC